MIAATNQLKISLIDALLEPCSSCTIDGNQITHCLSFWEGFLFTKLQQKYDGNRIYIVTLKIKGSPFQREVLDYP